MRKFDLWPVILLLLIHFFIRHHHPTLQYAYVDEGFHARRAAVVWDFEQNPGRLAHGKVLLYFWMGLFEGEPLHALHLFRTSIAIFSLITAATLYKIGTILGNHRTGLVALGLYTFFPLAVFYERMAMADPLTAGFQVLVIWRSLIFAKKPTFKEGGILGILLAFATLAKLTTALFVLMPAAVALLCFSWRRASIWPQISAWMKIYLPPLMLAAFVFILMWSPIVVPALIAHNTDEPFALVDTMTLRKEDSRVTGPTYYIEHVIPLLDEFWGSHFLGLLGSGLTVSTAVWLWRREFYQFRIMLLFFLWVALIIFLPVTRGTLITTRYFMPLSAPLCLVLAYFTISLWPSARISGAWMLVIGLWWLTTVWSFVYTDLSAPDELPFSNTNWTEFQAGYLIGDPAVQQAAAHINGIDSSEEIYATWNLCHLLYFYVENENLTCFPWAGAYAELRDLLYDQLNSGESIYLAFADYSSDPPFFQNFDGIEWEELGWYKREQINRPVSVWRLVVK